MGRANSQTFHAIGNLTADPESRTTGGDKTVTNFTVAVSKSRSDGKGGYIDNTTFFKCEAWEKTGERAAKAKKGNLVHVIGEFKTEQWETKDGQKREALKLVVNRFDNLSDTGGSSDKGGGGGNSGGKKGDGGGKKPAPAPEPPEDDDDIY